MYRVIISRDFFGRNESEEKIKKEIESWGGEFLGFEPELGAVTANMSFKSYDRHISRLRKNVEECMDGIVEDKRKYASILDIKANYELTEFRVICKKNTAKTRRAAAAELYMCSTAFQVFSGVAQNEANTDVLFIDAESGVVMDDIDTAEILNR